MTVGVALGASKTTSRMHINWCAPFEKNRKILRSSLSTTRVKRFRHPSTLSVFIRPYAVCFRWWRRKSCKTHTSAKLLHCLLRHGATIWRRRAILQDRHRCMLSAAKAAIWQVSRTTSTCASAPFYFSPQLCDTTSLPLSLSSPVFVGLARPALFFFSSSCSPLCLPLSSPLSTGASSSLQAWISRRNKRKRED